MTLSNYYVIPRTVYSTSNPTVNHDTTKGMEVGQYWVNTTTKDTFQCKDNTAGAAKWHTAIFQIDPLETTVPSYQTEINNAVTNKTLLITPEIIYGASSSIAYDVTVPTASSAMSLGPITIETGFTVTVEGIWTIV